MELSNSRQVSRKGKVWACEMWDRPPRGGVGNIGALYDLSQRSMRYLVTEGTDRFPGEEGYGHVAA
eukprot:15592049-Heterocapsa_arctica.AAC.1